MRNALEHDAVRPTADAGSLASPNLPRLTDSISAPPEVDHPWRWVPIRSLAARHRERITQHLLLLSPADRYLRFGYLASNAQVSKYVDTLDFERDEIFGIFNRRLALIAVAHVAYAHRTTAGSERSLAEFGVSVLPMARGRGYGSRLFDHAILHARNRNIDAIFIHALSENRAMLKIAQKAGAVIQRDATESEAWLKLPDDNIATQLEEVFAEQAAELDYRLKQNVKRFQELIGSGKNAIAISRSEHHGDHPDAH